MAETLKLLLYRFILTRGEDIREQLSKKVSAILDVCFFFYYRRIRGQKMLELVTNESDISVSGEDIKRASDTFIQGPLREYHIV